MEPTSHCYSEANLGGIRATLLKEDQLHSQYRRFSRSSYIQPRQRRGTFIASLSDDWFNDTGFTPDTQSRIDSVRSWLSTDFGFPFPRTGGPYTEKDLRDWPITPRRAKDLTGVRSDVEFFDMKKETQRNYRKAVVKLMLRNLLRGDL